MRLYHSPTSPYVRKVMVVLHETGLLAQVDQARGAQKKRRLRAALSSC